MDLYSPQHFQRLINFDFYFVTFLFRLTSSKSLVIFQGAFHKNPVTETTRGDVAVTQFGVPMLQCNMLAALNVVIVTAFSSNWD